MVKHGRTAHRAASESQSLTKIPTGIGGRDDILEGGFPAGRTTPISGTKRSNSYHQFMIADHGIEIAGTPEAAKLSGLHRQPSTARSRAEATGNQGGEE